ncbi:MAG: DUF1801 domain-containing protein [Rhodoferax sp.]|jgi:hypothetical protein|nr:DUF1801 domain-containing protein [Rhodoferax sp.]
MSNPESSGSPSPEVLTDQRIDALADWRGETLRLMRQRVRAADPAITEEWKWAKATSPGVPVWLCAGIVCTGEVYASVVKLTFARGAALADPGKLFNASLEGRVRRAIDIRKGEQIDAEAFEALVRAAVALNRAKAK